MNWIAVLIESIAWCFIFAVMISIITILTIKKKNYTMINLSYPPEIVDRLIEQGKLQKDEKIPVSKRLIKKLPILIFYIAAFTCLLYFVNGCRTFLDGFLSSFIIMISWTWFDALIIDCILFCNTKLFVIEGTEDMVDAYHDYWFHIKASLAGTVLSIVGSLAIGAIIALISIF